MRPRALLVVALGLSGLGDAAGGLWAVFDAPGVSAFMARLVPDWDAVARLAASGLADDALRQLWANLGTALVALGALQLVAAAWVRGGHPAGLALARIAGVALMVAAALLAGPGGQLSALATEGARGAAIFVLAWLASDRPSDRG